MRWLPIPISVGSDSSARTDPSHTIILGPGGRVMDMHRVAGAVLEGRPTIPALRFADLPDYDVRNCRPDEVPY